MINEAIRARINESEFFFFILRRFGLKTKTKQLKIKLFYNDLLKCVLALNGSIRLFLFCLCYCLTIFRHEGIA